MTDLHPTRTRLDLLQDAKDGLIVADRRGDVVWRDERLAGIYNPITATRTKVTARARELEQAEWIVLGGSGSYNLTDAGREILRAANR
ncbi:hypothetical protein [Paractinoplanes toevensis]|uniref:Uncharacterized protein n=1 Tax=Paractinoplanes toevensis TaxID=571911 RepID=A0A919T786_9ACTN|nr:hypothetical protein [Actinoplanes toevensis]GIM88856.1 hypothetical protein Ato02nite_006490 [Actinoplanes toevensis]